MGQGYVAAGCCGHKEEARNTRKLGALVVSREGILDSSPGQWSVKTILMKIKSCKVTWLASISCIMCSGAQKQGSRESRRSGGLASNDVAGRYRCATDVT